jgi:hypothetical protein
MRQRSARYRRRLTKTQQTQNICDGGITTSESTTNESDEMLRIGRVTLGTKLSDVSINLNNGIARDIETSHKF